MIVLGVHREDAFKDMFRGTTAERIIRGSNVPVLLVKDRPNNPYRRLVVGVDFSVYSRRAIEFAIDFVPSGEFHLVHAYDVPFKGFLYGHDIRKQISKKHQIQFQKMIEDEMAAFLGGFESKGLMIKRVMQEGPAREVIHRQVRRLKPDLLVVGTHGRTGVAHALLGSVAEDLLSQPPCDVLAVKAW
jgi:nucleotide-binding universal stress UspA family protein